MLFFRAEKQKFIVNFLAVMINEIKRALIIIQQTLANKSVALSPKKILAGAGFLLVTFFLSQNFAFGQSFLASPSNWLYPEGDSRATKRNPFKSERPQNIDDFVVKWTNSDVSGDVTPLIGNVIPNNKYAPAFIYAPNELVAVIGGKAVVVDGSGRTHKTASLPPFVKSASVLFDSLNYGYGDRLQNPLCVGLETVESKNLKEKLALAYVCSFDDKADTLRVLKRLAVDLRAFDSNYFASIKPFFGKYDGSERSIYAVVNMSNPSLGNPQYPGVYYYRGLAQFNAVELSSFYPLNDLGDDAASRQYLAPSVNAGQPSISQVGSKLVAALPCYPSLNLNVDISSSSGNGSTNSETPYLFAYDISAKTVSELFPPVALTQFLEPTDQRPLIRPYIVKLNDGVNGEDYYFLVTKGFFGYDGSSGTPEIMLFDKTGTPLTLPASIAQASGLSPNFSYGKDCLWSIAVGDLDGSSENALPPSYPNNPGMEIIATASSRDFVSPDNALIVLRYNAGSPVPKKSPPNFYLNKFDTICVQKINGWVAAVNDIDGAPDGKDEIFLVDGSRLRILRMNDYKSYDFRDGRYFDTVKTFDFGYETILNVAIADMEGDGKNDVIVATNEKTYLIGIELKDYLQFLSPKRGESFCVGDSVYVVWRNIFLKNPLSQRADSLKCAIYFRPYLDENSPLDTLILVADSVQNSRDTVKFLYAVDSLVWSRMGVFIIKRLDDPSISDSSKLIYFNKAKVLVYGGYPTSYRAGDPIAFKGWASCVDSVELQFSFDGSDWTTLDKQPIDSLSEYFVSGEAPCSPFYECLLPDRTDSFLVRIVGLNETYDISSDTLRLELKPEIFPITIEPCETACPTRVFRWNSSEIRHRFDTLIIAYASVGSSTFSLIDKVPLSQEEYEWDVPTDIPNEMTIRFCGESSCVRTDVLLDDLSPTFIGSVSPNPFSPSYEEVSIVYQVPKDERVSLQIFDQANRLVKEIVKDEFRRAGTAYCDKWDGRVWDGSRAGNGIYYILLKLSDGRQEIYPVYVKR